MALRPRRDETGSAGARRSVEVPMTRKPLQLGRPVPIPESPDEAELDRVPNPQAATKFVARFTAPEFTSICPVTGQPDFGILVIDYVPNRWLIESKSLKLYLQSFRNHGAFHEDVTVTIGRRARRPPEAPLAADRRILQPARRHADRCVLADRQAARRRLAARSGRRPLPRTRIADEQRAHGGLQRWRHRHHHHPPRFGTPHPRERRTGRH